MAMYMVNVFVLRIPYVKYKVETYTIGSKEYPTRKHLEKALKRDKNVIDFIM